MIPPSISQNLKSKIGKSDYFDQEILQIIHQQKWLQIWVPKKYNGLDYSLIHGLKLLQQLAEIDGSLGWFVTLCSGANFFSRNLKENVAKEVFFTLNVCLGGSGMITGTATKTDDNYLINGTWHYATGAPELTHITLNAQLIENGTPLINSDGSPVFKSFLLEASQVHFINNWNSMGMMDTASDSFEVRNQLVSEERSFSYDKFYTNGVLDQIPFEIFADLTLLVNYLGMAKHYAELSLKSINLPIQQELLSYIQEKTKEVYNFASDTEKILTNNANFSSTFKQKVHHSGEEIIEKLSEFIIKIYPYIGIKACKVDEEINRVFRDYFTATQHKNFRRPIPNS
ncbi:hypothetical protein [Tenacibaculum sp. IB213877]|uniref:hypothetical protein n=1 Tax=Tenacibaculum sp. IB213877 TaxID=3097351 RepID=UPI002A59B4FC|nr:hypothetical protein [Tenacibaculum sp. IB213877]MDY0779892.1 hypothetical protein [Tenacibaculum sp. IB213877]